MELLAKTTLLTFVLNSLYAMGALAITLICLAFCQQFLGGRIEIKKELFKGNLAVAIVVASVVIGVCFVVGTANSEVRIQKTEDRVITALRAKKYGRITCPIINERSEEFTPSSVLRFLTTDKYDRYFKKYAHRHFARGLDWRWFKAQGIAESGLEPKAVSPVGAKGLMQIMPATWDELMPEGTRIWQFSAAMSIAAGIAYDRQMWGRFPLQNGRERRRMMFAAYNCGPGNLAQAKRLAEAAGWSENWRAISCWLPKITGYHAWETIHYIRRIEAIKGQI